MIVSVAETSPLVESVADGRTSGIWICSPMVAHSEVTYRSTGRIVGHLARWVKTRDPVPGFAAA